MSNPYPKSLSTVAGIMLLLAVPTIWPYGYFQILRWVVAVAAGLNAYTAYNSNMAAWLWVMVAIAVLFNPIAPIHLSKEIWVIIDLIAAGIFFTSLTKIKKI